MRTWTIAQHLHQNTKGDSKREDLRQQDSERSSRTTRASSSGRAAATEDPSCEKKVRLDPNIDGDTYIKKFDDPAKNVMPQVLLAGRARVIFYDNEIIQEST